MQNRYAGDVGDYVKFALLRCLSQGRSIGVAWYLHPDEGHNSDGKHIDYVRAPARWRELDAPLFDALYGVVKGERSIGSLQGASILNGVFSGELLSSTDVAPPMRDDWRRQWFARVLLDLKGKDIVFADPDNGLVDDQSHRRREKKFAKQISLSEANALAEGRVAVIYHHNTRRKGGHDSEVNFWLEQLGIGAIAVRANAYSCRTFFILNPDEVTRKRAESFCALWSGHSVRLHV